MPFGGQIAGRGSGLYRGTVRKQLFQWGTVLSPPSESLGLAAISYRSGPGNRPGDDSE